MVRESERGRVMTRNSEKEQDGVRGTLLWQEIARMSVKNHVMVREREREGPKKSVSNRVMVRESEKDRLMAINS